MKIRKEFYIGLVATFTLVGVYLGFNFLSGKDIFNRNTKYVVVYEKIAGLSVSNSVHLNGFKIGMVSDLELMQDDSLARILVELSIDKNIKLPKNSVAKIESDFLGLNTISIIKGSSDEIAQEGDTLHAAIATTIQEEVSTQMLPIKAKTENMLASLDSVLEAIKYVFNKETQKTLANTFQRIQSTIENIDHASSTLDTMITGQKGDFEQIFANLTAITNNINDNNEKISLIIQNFADISDSLAQVDIKKTIDKADKALENFASISEKINSGDGSLSLLLNNDTLYRQLESASHELDKLLEDMKLHPKRYVHFSVFGKSDKKNAYKDPDLEEKK